MIASFIAASLVALQPQNWEPDLDAALGTAGLTVRTAKFDEAVMPFFGAGEFTAPLYTALQANPWRLPFVAAVKRKELQAANVRPADSVLAGGQWLGWAVRRNLLGNPNQADETFAARSTALAEVLAEYRRLGLINQPTPPLSPVPQQVQRAAALVLRVLLRARHARRAAISELGDPAAAFQALLGRKQAMEELQSAQPLLRLMHRMDTRTLAAGAYDFFAATQTATGFLDEVPANSNFNFQINTGWGLVRLTGGGDTVHADVPSLLVIDTAGNDTYLNAPATRNASNWCSVVLDVRGDDRYLSDPALAETDVDKFAKRAEGRMPGPGSAVMGYSMLWDMDGNDIYRTHRPGLGSGIYGFAAVVDEMGNDVYDAYQDSQGFGMFGAGILEDAAGNDQYRGFTQVQGVGLTLGFGYLSDHSGDDSYLANDTVLDIPSAQSAEHNVSMAQGAATGRRADFLDGRSLAGGVGILFDQVGNDTYSCGVFGQGVGYWKGIGMLWDLQGNDQYLGQWYVQGASAHYAYGLLEDLLGDDLYTAGMNMAQGAGHDFGLGALVDHSGNDRYKAPNLSLGAGNANGIGWLLEISGNDNYESSGLTLGKAAESPKLSLRERTLCLGIFIDFGGDDTYPAGASWAQDNSRIANWTDRGLTSQESQVGIFWDR